MIAPRFHASLGALLVAGSLLCCGGPELKRPATNADFRAIQRHEATIEKGQHAVTQPDLSCPEVCRAVAEVTDASTALCTVAEQTSDLDAHTRCDRAQDAARSTHALAARCACPAVSEMDD